MKRITKKRQAFTLPEVLVTVTIISLLAAVVIPTVAGQLSKGDTSKVSGDLLALRGGVEQFVADVRRYPGSVDHLLTKINTTSNQPINSGFFYTPSDQARWKGPYISRDVRGTSGTGYSLTIGDLAMQCWAASSNSTAGAVTAATATTTASCASGQGYVVTTISNVTATDAQAIDTAMDDGNAQTGAIRISVNSSTGTATVTLTFLVMPIQ